MEARVVRPDEELEVEDVEDVEDEAEESRIANRAPRAPQLTRLGRYRLVREIASGGMASVNLAVTEGLDKLVALKMIHPHLADQESFVHMFLDEARIASSISHRNVCNTFDFGEAEGRYYIAMDFLAGQSLRDLIFRLRRSPAEAEPRRLAAYMAYILAEACEGLHAAHELRDSHGAMLDVVHRDVSPHNLFLTYDGNVSVVDFGIARAANRLQQTATGILKGKFSYMAPEQIRQTTVDRRADIWSLGVCLWECLTLERLFVRSNQADTLMSVMVDKVRLPSELRPELPKTLDAIVEKALSRNLEERYATAREMGRDLMRVVRESGVQVGPVEIEHWLEKLFARERDRTRALTRQAKQAALEGSWPDGIPSMLPRIPTRSGAMPIQKNPGSGSVPRADLFSHPAVPLRAESENELGGVSSPEPQNAPLPRRNMFIAALVGLAAAVGVSWAFEDTVVTPPVGRTPVASAAAHEQSALRPNTIQKAQDATPAPAAIVVAPAPESDTTAALAPLPSPAESSVRAKNLPGDRRAKPGTIASRPAAAGEGASVAVAPGAQAAPVPSAILDAGAPARAPEVQPPAPIAAAPAPQTVVPAPVPVAKAPVAQAPTPAAFVRQKVQASFDDLEVEGSLGKGAVARMLSRATPLMQSCYESAAQRSGKNDLSPLDVSLSIDETGAVRSVESGTHSLSGMSRCVGDALKRIRSDSKPDIGTVRVRLHISFRPQ